MVTGPRVAEFIHAHRLYRILPLKRGEEPSNEPSYFELNAQGLSRNRVNLVHAPLDVMIDLLTIPEDCTTPLCRVLALSSDFVVF